MPRCGDGFKEYLRRRDIRFLQEKLASVGLSSLGRCESRALANIDVVLKVIGEMTGQNLSDALEENFTLGKCDLERHTEAALGARPANRDVRIMVTMPSEAATDYGLVSALVSSGMDCMRINCAHDHPDAWAAMVEHLRRAQHEHKKVCRVHHGCVRAQVAHWTNQICPGCHKIETAARSIRQSDRAGACLVDADGASRAGGRARR